MVLILNFLILNVIELVKKNYLYLWLFKYDFFVYIQEYYFIKYIYINIQNLVTYA